MIFADIIILPKEMSEEGKATQNQNSKYIAKQEILSHAMVSDNTILSELLGISNVEIELEPDNTGANVEPPIIMPQLPSTSKMSIPQNKSNPFVVEEISSKDISKGIDLPSPIYPKRAIEERLEGEVIVELLIGRSGSVISVSVIKSSKHSILDQVCVNTIQEEWVFPPADTIRKTTKRFVFSLQ
jgi:TonB family protein